MSHELYGGTAETRLEFTVVTASRSGFQQMRFVQYSNKEMSFLRLFFCMQTRSLLGVFEEDTAAISNYCTQLYQAMQRIYDAQVHKHAAAAMMDARARSSLDPLFSE